jgi:hypothetical protein
LQCRSHIPLNQVCIKGLFCHNNPKHLVSRLYTKPTQRVPMPL